MKKSFVVSLEIPDGVSVTEMREYIRDAVGWWCKGTNPEYPIFDLDANKVRVKVLKTDSRKRDRAGASKPA